MKKNSYLVALLRERKLKATSARLEVLSAISDYNNAIPFSEIRKILHDVDRVTLYRTIQTLTENGIIHKALKDEGETFFAMCSKNCTSDIHNHKHIHFKCSTCQTVTCVRSVHPIRLSIPGYSIENFEIEAIGICMSCIH